MKIFLVRPSKVNLDLYTNFLIATQKQYSCTELEQVSPIEDLSHDAVNRFLKKNNFDSSLIWEEVKQDIDKESGYLIFDDTLIDKPYSEKIELTKWQWSGKHHAVKKGIGLTNCLWLNQNGLSMPVDYRIYNKDEDSKTKNDHFLEMLNACEEKPKNYCQKRMVLHCGY